MSGIAAGVVAALVTVALLGATGVAVGWLGPGLSTESERTLIALLVAVPALVVGCAVGGWAAARVAHGRGPAAGAMAGLVTAAVALLVLAGLAWPAAAEIGDFQSVRLALGLIELPVDEPRRPDVPPAPALATPPVSPVIEPADIARQRTLDAAAYAIVVLLAAAGAGILGGVLGAAVPAAPPDSARPGEGSPARRRRPVLPNAGRGAVALALAATLLLSLVASGDGVLPGDTAVARWLQDADSPVAAALAHLADWVGSLPGLVAGAAMLTAFFVAAGRPWPAALVIAAVLARSLNPYLKELLDSPRPPDDLVRVTERASGLGFPSGHAMGVTLLFGTVIALTAEVIPAPLPRRLVQAGAAGVILLTGFGRVYTGAHWPSDVLGGYLWGTVVLLLLLRLRHMVLLLRARLPIDR